MADPDPCPAPPFWEMTYGHGQDEDDTFGSPGPEVVALAAALPPGARVLDLGCGEGRHALLLAARGCDVTAVDTSHAGVAKLRRLAAARGLPLRAEVADMRTFPLAGPYDVVIAHGSLHLIERAAWARLVPALQAHTRPGGYHVAVVFTDALPVPEDLRPFAVGVFREGELFDLYAGWDAGPPLGTRASYVLDDEHPGGVRHRHAIDKLVARKPAGRAGAGPAAA